MLRQSKELRGCKLGARDGEIGHVEDFLFDDEAWTVRYFVANTGDWLPHRTVLISPFAVTGVHSTPHKALEVNLTKKQIEESPSIEANQPVTRQFEYQYSEYFGWPCYWPGPLLWGPVEEPRPSDVIPQSPATDAPGRDSRLRSVNEIAGYYLQALDHQFGHVEQFIFEERNWAIRYLVADTRNWWPGKRVLLSPQWLPCVSWPESRVYVDFDRETIRRAPAFDPGIAITREYEQSLFDHYNREPYWLTNDCPTVAH